MAANTPLPRTQEQQSTWFRCGRGRQTTRVHQVIIPAARGLALAEHAVNAQLPYENAYLMPD
ncbi:hypothetical protein CSB45_06910 [candidate division KSB3 bacterium]|uniref:Uncharacterized protein n=1 Tax=candidate division KSB3 bacterium TaxID=2044937 RepID=A0A2G6E6M9_9BACT|nr:MAG: hypothetical protein CSB45_06910 [candidate division KSB3 bacterium]PIE30035.1 MAG: hypothetical protein CSA57_05685 [candidate division KSB3 bacterium]